MAPSGIGRFLNPFKRRAERLATSAQPSPEAVAAAEQDAALTAPPAPMLRWFGHARLSRRERGRREPRRLVRPVTGIEATSEEAARRRAIARLRDAYPADEGWTIFLPFLVTDEPGSQALPV